MTISIRGTPRQLPDAEKRNARISWWIPQMIANAPLAIHNMSFNISFMFRATALISKKSGQRRRGTVAMTIEDQTAYGRRSPRANAR
jgi:hypothetical protein